MRLFLILMITIMVVSIIIHNKEVEAGSKKRHRKMLLYTLLSLLNRKKVVLPLPLPLPLPIPIIEKKKHYIQKEPVPVPVKVKEHVPVKVPVPEPVAVKEPVYEEEKYSADSYSGAGGSYDGATSYDNKY